MRDRGLVLTGRVIAGGTGQGALALDCLTPGPPDVRPALAWAFGAIGLAPLVSLAFLHFRRNLVLALALAAAFIGVLLVFFTTSASNERD